MPRGELHLLRRADARAVVASGLVLVVVLALQGLALFAYAAQESLEQADGWVEQVREMVATVEARELSDASLADAVYAALPGGKRAVRIRRPDGGLGASLGAWPPAERSLLAQREGDPDRGLGSFRLLRQGRFLVDSIALPSGARLELALPLKRFAKEAREMGRGIVLLVAVSSLVAFAASFLATRRAFAPLREATALLAGVNVRALGARLPSRRTGDPVDRHAETLNRVLEAIDAAFSRLRSFSSDVAHEFRTPLNRMRTVAEVALASGDAAEQRAALERVEASVDELARLVDSLLLIAEADDRRVPLAPERIDVDEWLARTAEAYGPLFEERGAKLWLDSRAGTIEADRALLDRVLLNLLENALRHGSAGGRVELSAEPGEGGVRIAVEDAGPGVAPEDSERVFERFERLDRTRRGSTGGLGLALARAIARLLGGDLVVEPSRLGGARFLWWLPSAPAKEVA
jgi:two-component system heavy metal sensor histidine kinase CusS